MRSSARIKMFLFLTAVSVTLEQSHAAVASDEHIAVHKKMRTNNMGAVVRIFQEDFLQAESECKRGGPYDYPKCAPGLWCVGNSPPRCVKRSTIGGKCGTEYEVCGTGQLCKSGLCAMIPRMDVNYLKKGEVCKRGKGKRCFPGLWCVVGRCRRLVACGGSCGLETEVCRPGLECKTIHKTRAKICGRVRRKGEQVRQDGESCVSRGARCRLGLVCVERGDRGTCRVPARLGQACGGECSDCESGRVCSMAQGVCVV